MKEVTFRRWHRYVGISFMPLLGVQVISGFVLTIVETFGFIERTPQTSSDGLTYLVVRKLPKFLSSYDELMMSFHFTGWQLFGGILRILTSIAFLWVMFSGTYIFLGIRARTRQSK